MLLSFLLDLYLFRLQKFFIQNSMNMISFFLPAHFARHSHLHLSLQRRKRQRRVKEADKTGKDGTRVWTLVPGPRSLIPRFPISCPKTLEPGPVLFVPALRVSPRRRREHLFGFIFRFA